MSPAILERAQQLIEARGFSGLSALVESLIREEWERRGGEARVPQSRPKLKIAAAVSPQISIEQARDLAASYADPLTALSTQPDQAFPSTADPVDTPAKPRAILRRRRSRSLPNVPATGTPITPIDTSEP